MKKRTYVGALTRPISLTAAIRVENPYNAQNTNQYGTLSQAFDSLTGDYYPDRSTYPTLLGLHVLMEDPNSASAQGEVAWTGANTVSWEVVRNGVTTPITAQSLGDFTLSGTQLRVRMNQTVADGNVLVRATGTFHDSVGRSQTAVAEVNLLLSTSTATNLTLLRDKLGTTGYVGDFFRLNPLTLDTVAKLDNTANWRKKCAVQLCDGTTPLPDAFPLDNGGDAMDEDDYADTPQGSAFYFWFYRTPDGRLIQCTEDTEWLDAAWLPTGTASKEVAVDLTKIQQVRLVCRAGYIPYGQLEDYIDEDGIVRVEKLYLGFREQTFDVGVELPDVERITDADIAHCRLERTELASSAITIVKRAMVMAGGTTLNNLSETTPHGSSTQSWVEKLYAIEWFVTRANGTDVSIGTGEWLQITPAQLAALYGSALDADDMPPMSISVEPRYPKLTGNNYAEGYQRGGTAVTPSQQQGNKGFLKQLDLWLLDTTDNAGDTTHALKLRRNNILRFASGEWAPAVGISEAMAADAGLELWRKKANGAYVKYCDAGGYDPETFVENVLRKHFNGTLSGWYAESDGGWPRLYKKDGANYVEAHALLPWETTETKWTTVCGYGYGVYLLDHLVGQSGWEWNGIFTDRTEWDGIDLTPYYLAPTGIAPGPCGLASGNKLRNFFWLSRPSGWNGGNNGLAGDCALFNEDGRHYPFSGASSSGLAGDTARDYARKNNSDANRSYPFGELGFHALNTLISSRELLHSRRTLQDKDFFGSGISSNDACTTAEEWAKNGGVRFKESGAAQWTYATFTETSALGHSEAGSSYQNWSYGLSNARAKMQVMEAQLAASFAAEFGIAATMTPTTPTAFTVYGNRFWWMAPTGVESLGDGYMNCRVYKEVTGTVSGTRRSDSASATFEVDVCLRSSLMGGLDLCGDIYVYGNGGADVIYTATSVSRTGLPVKCMLITDQRKWVKETTSTLAMADASRYPVLADGEKFLIEKSADAMSLVSDADVSAGLAVNHATAYSCRRQAYSPFSLVSGGGLTSGEVVYNYTTLASDPTLGNRVRLGLRFRGSAHSPNVCPRLWYGYHAVSTANNRNFGCSAQALIGM